MAGLVALGASVAVAGVLGLVLRRRQGRLRETRRAPTAGGLDLTAELGLTPGGQQVTLVQFSTAFCQPCVATRRILEQVAGMVPGVSHVEIDAESHLGLVRRLGIMRTPTVLVLDAAGREVKRATGTPRKADVIAAIGPMITDMDTPRSPRVG